MYLHYELIHYIQSLVVRDTPDHTRGTRESIKDIRYIYIYDLVFGCIAPGGLHRS